MYSCSILTRPKCFTIDCKDDSAFEFQLKKRKFVLSKAQHVKKRLKTSDNVSFSPEEN